MNIKRLLNMIIFFLNFIFLKDKMEFFEIVIIELDILYMCINRLLRLYSCVLLF